MKIRITILILIILASCNQRSDNGEQADQSNASDTVSTPKLISTGLAGNWVNKKYVDKLLATGSPRESQDITPITMLIIPEMEGQEATIIWGFHEGINGTVKRQNGRLGIQIGEGNEFELTFTLGNDVLKTEKGEFVRIKSSRDHSDFDIVEQLLFEGKYDYAGQEVEFSYDGKVTGLDAITYYTSVIDYNDAGMQVDQLKLGSDLDNSKYYGFQFNQDTLIIYQLDCVTLEDDYCVVVQFGQEILKMTKK